MCRPRSASAPAAAQGQARAKYGEFGRSRKKRTTRREERETRKDITDVLRLAEVQGAGLRSDAVAVGAVEAATLEATNAQGTEAVGVAHGAHEFVRDDDDRERSLGLGHGVEDLVHLRLALRM